MPKPDYENAHGQAYPSGYAIALHFVYYNFVKQHKTLRTTPAMAAGLTKRFMTVEDIAKLIPEPQAKKRGTYKRRENIRRALTCV